jgi:amino acid transporter
MHRRPHTDFGSITKGGVRNTEPLVTSGSGVLTVVLVVPAVFVGFDVIPQAAEAMNISLVRLIDASAFGTVAACFMATLSFLILCKTEPGMPRPCKVKGRGEVVGILAVGVAFFFLCLCLPIGPAALIPAEWTLVLGRIALGVVFFVLAKNKHRDVTSAECEVLMFGGGDARKDKLKNTAKTA